MNKDKDLVDLMLPKLASDLNSKEEIKQAPEEEREDFQNFAGTGNSQDLRQMQQKQTNTNLIGYDSKKQLKKSTRAKLALLGSIKGVCKDFYSQTSSATVPSMYLNFLNKDEDGDEEFKGEHDQDINPGDQSQDGLDQFGEP